MKKSTQVTQETVTTIDLTPQDIEALIIEALKLKSHDNVSVDFDIRQGGGFLAGALVRVKDIVTSGGVE